MLLLCVSCLQEGWWDSSEGYTAGLAAPVEMLASPALHFIFMGLQI